VEVQPGTKWVYDNHGFAALGQIVEDVSGQPLDHFLRGHIFDPLGMGSKPSLSRSASASAVRFSQVMDETGAPFDRPVVVEDQCDWSADCRNGCNVQ
jgi:CubicO group peptidase (beta-lactamase class C family)